ncbi:MAG: amidohydrolase [Acidimicrobiia bacterium]|nr:amidohydrolase [Acidimicrobiia bacterium]
MYNDTRVLDVHGHVSHPFGGMGQTLMFMQAMNSPVPSPIGTDGAGQAGLGDEQFEVSVGRHVDQLDDRNIDKQVIGPRPFLMQGFMERHLLPAWTRVVNDAINKQCEMHPDRFLGACQLPQDAHAADAAHMLDELTRCVDDYGFAGVYVSPDPEGRRNSPGLAEDYWNPLYETCEERQLPIIVHGTNCLDPRFEPVPHSYQLGFVSEQYWANQILSHSDVFERFPALKVIICHCGGALDRWIPNDPHLAQKDLSANLFYDTCAHDEPYLECAIKQRTPARMCFGSEVPGSGSALREGSGRPADDLVPIIGGFDFLSEEEKNTIFHENPARLFPALAK